MIPPLAHFVWFGRSLPWAYALAVMTAARRGGFDAVCLHHADVPDGGPGWRAAEAEPGVRLVPLVPRERLGAIASLGDPLVRLYEQLQAPAARANMIRAAILLGEGGVYLDTDTITIASLTPLRSAAVFAGLERIALPYTVRQSINPLRWAKAGALLAVRDGMRRWSHGHRVFGYLAPLFDAAANNAVIGAEPGNPFIASLLQGMVDTPRHRQRVRFALGTNLLQATIDGQGPGRDALVLHPPPVFYPLGPEVSEHWFRERRSAALTDVVSPVTRVIHWYASVRTRRVLPQIDEAYVRARADHQLFSAAAVAALDG